MAIHNNPEADCRNELVHEKYSRELIANKFALTTAVSFPLRWVSVLLRSHKTSLGMINLRLIILEHISTIAIGF